MFKFLHAADIHLDSPLRGLERYEGAPVEEIQGATRRALQNLIDVAIEEQVAFVLLVGDLYDGDWRDYNTGLYFTRQMARLRDAGIRAFVVAGNHDAASQLSKTLRPPDNVHILATRAPETVVLEQWGVAIHGQGFPTRAVAEDLTQAYPLADPDLFNVGLLHTSLDGRPGHEPYAPCTIDALCSRGYQYWALGHVHKREVVSREPWIVFPGNIQGRHIRETGAKGCTLVTVQGGAVCECNHRVLDVVRWADCQVDLSDTTSLDAVYDQAGSALLTALDAAAGRLLAARLRFVGTCPFHTKLRAVQEQVLNECRAVAATIGTGDLWIEKILFETRLSVSEEAALARDDAFGGLLRAIRDLEVDEAQLATLGDEIADLMARLPVELRTGAEAFDPADPACIRESLEDVKALLLDRLLSEGQEEGE